jgi:hypothetical protein
MYLLDGEGDQGVDGSFRLRVGIAFSLVLLERVEDHSILLIKYELPI